jgi:hypothetical protein
LQQAALLPIAFRTQFPDNNAAGRNTISAQADLVCNHPKHPPTAKNLMFNDSPMCVHCSLLGSGTRHFLLMGHLNVDVTQRCSLLFLRGAALVTACLSERNREHVSDWKTSTQMRVVSRRVLPGVCSVDRVVLVACVRSMPRASHVPASQTVSSTWSPAAWTACPPWPFSKQRGLLKYTKAYRLFGGESAFRNCSSRRMLREALLQRSATHSSVHVCVGHETHSPGWRL